MGGWQLDGKSITAIIAGTYHDAFSVLGLHQHAGKFVARVFAPYADRLVALNDKGKELATLELRDAAGFFEGIIPLKARRAQRYRAANESGTWEFVDPFSFGPVLGPMDDYYFAEGTHLRLFDKLGAHAMEFEGVLGVHFAVWAPNAKRVSVVGQFNNWDGRRYPMRFRGDSGVWEIFLPELGAGAVYKFEIIGVDGTLLPLKADPYAQQSQLRPENTSVVADPAPFEWTDQAYLEKRAQKNWRREPIAIYEVHLGSWRRSPDGGFFSYDQLVEQLIPYALDMGFTHLELLPVCEHPLDASWGYQPIGLYSPTARFGDPRGFARFVNAAHKAGLGIIIDWVPAHFPTDEYGLIRFDGTALYEHADPRLGFHPDWNTAIYNFGRREVASFLINNALFWLEKYHIDGLRVDAVASMLYLDYSRQPGDWLPNRFGGNQNLEAIAFLKRFNSEVYAVNPGIFTIAEESTSFAGVSAPVDAGGLGFGFKWNMGFMHDTLSYMSRDPVYRRYHHNDMTFGLLYAWSENFVLPFSHDEVVHGKGSLLNKMSGDDWQKFASLRAFYGFVWAYPGKKLLFMGQEFAQRNEWSEERALDWHLLDAQSHEGVRKLLADLNRAYRDIGALHERDCEPEGFDWLIPNDRANSVFAFVRQAPGSDPVVVVSNFTPQLHDDYYLPMPRAGRWLEVINTDGEIYCGSNKGNDGSVMAQPVSEQGWPAMAKVRLPPLATLILKFDSAF